MSKRYGRQTPTFEYVGAYDHSDGPEAVALFEGYGIRFIPAQRYEMELYLAKNEMGESEALTIGLSRPRQNGKSFAARYYALWCAFVEGKSVLYSAHNGGTTRKMFKFMADFIELHEDFARKLRPGDGAIYRAKGSEGIYLASGVCIEFSTRTNSGARGGTYDVIVVDEAQELTDEQDDALSPTTIASDSGDPQMIYIGTPPNQKCPGTVFRSLHDRAHADELGDAWWLEWAATEIGDPHDVGRWYECNPMMGYRIKERAMRDKADTKPADSFAREYLGWWDAPTAAVEHVISEKAWALCETDEPPEPRVTCAGVKFGPDRATLAYCLCPAEGAAYVEWVDTRPLSEGVGWIASWLYARRIRIATVAIDGGSTAALTTRLTDRGFPKRAIVTAGPRDMAKAVSMLTNAVAEHDLAHYGQEELTASATLTARRRIGSDGVGFEDAGGADSTLIEACALALWQAKTTKRRPGRKAVVY